MTDRIPQNQDRTRSNISTLTTTGPTPMILVPLQPESPRLFTSVVVDAKFPITLSDFKIAIPNYKGITVAEKVDVRIKTKAKKL